MERDCNCARGKLTASGRILDKIGRMKVPAMLLKYRYASGACLFLALVLLTLGIERVVEPRFGGKGVREWIELMAADRNPDSDAARALEKLGIRAVPYLMQEAMQTESWQLKVAAKFPPEYRDIFGDRGYARQVSACSVAMLGRLGAAERKKNENQVEQSYPIAERVVPFFIEQISVKLRMANLDHVTRRIWSTGQQCRAAFENVAQQKHESISSTLPGAYDEKDRLLGGKF